jgi:ferredoxin/flavodoxin---NADP+ reductase
MFKVAHKQVIAQDIKRVDISASAIASRILPGQFVMISPDPNSKAIPMTVVDADEKKGVISFIVHEVGQSTKALAAKSSGDPVASVVGPLGKPSIIEKYGLVICVATGIGAAQILPICRALKKKGNKVVGIIGAKSKKVLMLEAQMRVVCDELFITTDDGSYERKGLATGLLKEMFNKYKVNAVYAIGSVNMMQDASQMAKERGIPARVTLNPYMTNGLGVCGSCRVQVGGRFQLACTDGPEFNGYAVDFNDLHKRDQAMKEKSWGNPNQRANQKSGGFQTFMKSFLGSAKNKT